MYLKSFDDVMLNVKVYEGYKDVIIINHGFSEHLGRYNHVAEYLNNSGYTVITYDLRGHGKTLAKRGHLKSYNEYILDCYELIKFAKDKYPQQNLYVFGHSMGGLVATLTTLNYQEHIKGLILSGPALYNLPKSVGMYKALLTLLHRLKPNLVIPNPVGDEICSDKAVVDANLKDPLVLHKVEVGMLYQFLVAGAKEVKERQINLRIPVLILHGEADAIVLPNTSKQFYEKISSSDKQLKIYPNLYHEILNERESKAILSDIEMWLGRGK